MFQSNRSDFSKTAGDRLGARSEPSELHLNSAPSNRVTGLILRSGTLMMKRREAVQLVTLAVGAFFTTGRPHEAMGRAVVAPDALLAELADVIIPTTTTPGAKAAGVEKFIIRMLRDCHSKQDHDSFYAGLAKLEDECNVKFGKPFAQLLPEQKVDFMKAFASVNKPFFLKLKQLTVTGYFNSEIGATQALAYLPIPGRFEGSVPLSPGQKAWAF